MLSANGSFASDNYAGVHPQILKAIEKCTSGHAPAYGNDEYTERAVEVFKKHFGPDIDVFFVFNGTGANIVALNSIAETYQSIICPQTAHINVDECGAIEKITGSRLIPIDTDDGKLTPELVSRHLRRFGDEHHAQPRVISISQATEYGILYQPEEMAALSDLAHRHNMLLHVDGSRICNAAAALSVDLRAVANDVGVDVLSFGGTKNGMMFGEAVVFFNKELSKKAKYFRKQNGQLASKHRFIAAQFIEMLNTDLWRKNAAHANDMAARLARGTQSIDAVRITKPVQCNSVFARLPAEVIRKLQQQFAFYVWDERTSEVRWMTAFDTTAEQVDAFIDGVKQALL